MGIRTTIVVPSSNALEVFWNMPDWTLIRAGEYGEADYSGAPQRKIMITFMSKDAIADAQRKVQSKPNPYGTPK